MVRGRTTGRGRGRGASAATASNDPDGATAAAATSTPSATPLPTPAAAPASSSAATPSTRARGAATARATRGPTARFRPKNVRRDEAERDALAREEEKKANERAADAARARGRSRLRSKRSRGDAMGSRGGRQMTASGPFSAGFASSGSRGGGGGWGGGGGGGGGGGWGADGGSSSRAVKGGKEFNVLDGSRNMEPRINADKLHHATATPDDEFDSDDEAMRATLSSRGATTIPMGIYRREHKEEAVIVATTAELEAAEASGHAVGEEESLFVADGSGDTTPALPSGDDEQPRQGEEVKVKDEPDDGAPDLMAIDDARPADEDLPKKDIPKKAVKVLPTDPEDKAIRSDMALLAEELGAVSVSANGEDAVPSKDGRLYLFQFPPLLPPLKSVPPPAATSSQAAVKTEPAEDGSSKTGDTTTSAPVDLTAEQPDEALDVEDDPEMEKGFMSSLLSRGGRIGKLNVRRSGRVEMDWGGTPLEMSPATAMNFLTTAVIVEESDDKPGSDGLGGDSIGMGKVMGRFVLAPVWPEEEEYEIPPDVHA